VRERVKINQDVLEQSLSCLKIKIYYLINFQVKNTLKNNWYHTSKHSYIILSESIIIIAHIYKVDGIMKACDISLCLVL
jgi:tyrosine-protein phosphatase YwqE